MISRMVYGGQKMHNILDYLDSLTASMQKELSLLKRAYNDVAANRLLCSQYLCSIDMPEPVASKLVVLHSTEKLYSEPVFNDLLMLKLFCSLGNEQQLFAVNNCNPDCISLLSLKDYDIVNDKLAEPIRTCFEFGFVPLFCLNLEEQDWYICFNSDTCLYYAVSMSGENSLSIQEYGIKYIYDLILYVSMSDSDYKIKFKNEEYQSLYFKNWNLSHPETYTLEQWRKTVTMILEGMS